MINKHLASLALDEDFLLVFVYIRSTAFIIVVTQKLVLQQSKNVTANLQINKDQDQSMIREYYYEHMRS